MSSFLLVKEVETMFSFLKKEKGTKVHAVVKGKIKPLEEVEDQVFSKGLIGQGIAIMPEDSIIKAPCDGTLSVVFPTGHAFGITDADGLEYLLHIGIDTVNLNGEGFTLMVEQGQAVKAGEPLVKVDFSLIKEKNIPTDTMILLTTPKDSCSFTVMVENNQSVSEQDVIFKCEKR